MAADYDPKRFYDDLVEQKLIVPVGVLGAYGRGPVFEDVLGRLNAYITRSVKDDGAETMLFPPVINRKIIEKSGFLDSLPHLGGAVFSFFGNDKQHRELAERARNGEPWGDMLATTDVVLTPAACYPVYPSVSGTAPADGRLIDVLGWVFRHEPSQEPTRLQSFRMRELIRVGPPEAVLAWRDQWVERGLSMLRALGLPAATDIANDPFFGRTGKMMAASQREQKLKFEILIPVISEEKPTACCSFNYHQDHFSSKFDIKLAGGAEAHTACLGFGLERCTLALFKHLGYDPKSWPKATRDLLWP
jgi:seryl-tRNA synthetase